MLMSMAQWIGGKKLQAVAARCWRELGGEKAAPVECGRGADGGDCGGVAEVGFERGGPGGEDPSEGLVAVW